MAVKAWNNIQLAHRPATKRAQKTHFSTFLAFALHHKLPPTFTNHTVLAFMQFLADNDLSPCVITNYISSLKTMALSHNMPHSALAHRNVSLFTKSLLTNTIFRPQFRGHFDLSTIRAISMACDSLPDPELYRAVFLIAFHAFLRISNVAPHSVAAFSQHKHLLRQDVIFAPPGAHLFIEWAKNMC